MIRTIKREHQNHTMHHHKCEEGCANGQASEDARLRGQSSRRKAAIGNYTKTIPIYPDEQKADGKSHGTEPEKSPIKFHN
ncbi:hypothetical protein CEXT_755001 [Caerostris extrusa]|uniref:Uncharacterized protein n=1 Tax=Caerostris extrusa TaxID=172846 RepID=A0AAV4U8X1_CAEEX|nr:hypothetical protein CEXT_755001 [Caerostris extrusa]